MEDCHCAESKQSHDSSSADVASTWMEPPCFCYLLLLLLLFGKWDGGVVVRGASCLFVCVCVFTVFVCKVWNCHRMNRMKCESSRLVSTYALNDSALWTQSGILHVGLHWTHLVFVLEVLSGQPYLVPAPWRTCILTHMVLPFSLPLPFFLFLQGNFLKSILYVCGRLSHGFWLSSPLWLYGLHKTALPSCVIKRLQEENVLSGQTSLAVLSSPAYRGGAGWQQQLQAPGGKVTHMQTGCLGEWKKCWWCGISKACLYGSSRCI